MKKSTNQFIKLLNQKYKSMLNRTFNSLKKFKKFNQLKNKARINHHLIFVVFLELKKNQNKTNNFIGENHNIQTLINYKI